MDIVKPISAISLWIVLFYMLCNFGDEVTDAFLDLNESIYDLLWYQLPVDQQKYVILMIFNANHPVYLEGLVIRSVRETFRKVENFTKSFFFQSIKM